MAQNFPTKKFTLDSLIVGQVVELTYIAPNKGRVIVNFDGDDDNIVFHISIRYDEGVIIFNTCQGGCWGNEERPEGYLFAPGNAIALRIATQADFYNIFCNGNEICKYQHRMPIAAVKAVSWTFEDSDADIKAKLQSFNFAFN